MEKGEVQKKKLSAQSSPVSSPVTSPFTREDKGLQRHAAPTTSRRRILSAGVIPVFQSEAGPLFLLLRAYSYWDFPKGCANPGEEALATAKREFQEETNIAKVSFPWGEDFRETPPYSHGKVARYYLGLVKSMEVELLPNPVHGQVEHHEYRWVNFEQARALLTERVRPILDWAERKMKSE